MKKLEIIFLVILTLIFSAMTISDITIKKDIITFRNTREAKMDSIETCLSLGGKRAVKHAILIDHIIQENALTQALILESKIYNKTYVTQIDSLYKQTMRQLELITLGDSTVVKLKEIIE